jgi:Transcription factor zinc-finger
MADRADEKDRLGDKLQDIRKAREEQWARQKDAELLEKMRVKGAQPALVCPQCKKPLVEKKINGVKFLACPDDQGAWLDAAALKAALKKQK